MNLLQTMSNMPLLGASFGRLEWWRAEKAIETGYHQDAVEILRQIAAQAKDERSEWTFTSKPHHVVPTLQEDTYSSYIDGKKVSVTLTHGLNLFKFPVAQCEFWTEKIGGIAGYAQEPLSALVFRHLNQRFCHSKGKI